MRCETCGKKLKLWEAGLCGGCVKDLVRARRTHRKTRKVAKEMISPNGSKK